MKKLLFMVTLIIILSCGEKTNSVENEKLQSELEEYEAFEATEAETKKFIEDYLRDIKSPDWKSKILKYLKPNPDEFLKEHAAFRESYANYESTIKHLMVDGNEGIVWLGITANYALKYPIDSGNYADDAIAGFEPKNQELSWDETWYFNVVDGRFGDKWDMVKDYNAILGDLKALELQ